MVDNVKCGAREIPLKSLYLEKLSDFCLRTEVSILEMMIFVSELHLVINRWYKTPRKGSFEEFFSMIKVNIILIFRLLLLGTDVPDGSNVKASHVTDDDTPSQSDIWRQKSIQYVPTGQTYGES